LAGILVPFGPTKTRLTKPNLQREEVIINKGITTDNIKNEVNQSYQNYKAALDKITLLQTSINQAQENNRILESNTAAIYQPLQTVLMHKPCFTRPK
jgi:outer membrane protein TolC